MIFKIILIIIVVVAILGGVFYLFDGKNYLVKKGCLNDATMQKAAAKNADDIIISGGVPLAKRSDYEKIFNDAYQECLKRHRVAE